MFSWLLIFQRFHVNSCHVPKSLEVYITLRMVSLDQHSKVWYEIPCDLDLAGWLSESSYISSDPIGGIQYCPLLANDCPLASWACVMDMSLYLYIYSLNDNFWMKNVEFMFVICVLGLSCNAKYLLHPNTLWNDGTSPCLWLWSDKQDDFYEFAINIEIW